MDDLIEVEDTDGNRTRVSAAHLKRWPSVAATFRPVADQKAAPVAAVKPPTGANKKEK